MFSTLHLEETFMLRSASFLGVVFGFLVMKVLAVPVPQLARPRRQLRQTVRAAETEQQLTSVMV